MSVILIDLDDVLFPFAEAYRDFRARRGLPGIPAGAWADYEIGEARIPGHQDLMIDFFHDPVVLATPPVPGRARSLQNLTGRHTFIGCTGRYGHTEGPGTRAWVNRWLPWVESVEFTGWHPESGRPSGKPSVAERHQAAALVDDTPVHLTGLPPGTEGLLAQRPPGVPSAAGALPWATVISRLHRLPA